MLVYILDTSWSIRPKEYPDEKKALLVILCYPCHIQCVILDQGSTFLANVIILVVNFSNFMRHFLHMVK